MVEDDYAYGCGCYDLRGEIVERLGERLQGLESDDISVVMAEGGCMCGYGCCDPRRAIAE